MALFAWLQAKQPFCVTFWNVEEKVKTVFCIILIKLANIHKLWTVDSAIANFLSKVWNEMLKEKNNKFFETRAMDPIQIQLISFHFVLFELFNASSHTR